MGVEVPSTSMPVENDIEDDCGLRDSIVAATPKPNPALSISIDDLDISIRTSNVLKNADIRFLGELATRTEQWLYSRPNCGRKTVNEVKAILASCGLCLGYEAGNWTRPESKTDYTPQAVQSRSLAEFD